MRALATNLVLMRLPEGVLEEMHTTLLFCHEPVLQERGAKGCAHLSLLTPSQVRLDFPHWEHRIAPHGSDTNAPTAPLE